MTQGEEVDHEAEEVLNELNLLTESETDTGGQGDDYPVGEFWLYAFTSNFVK